jgi:hypothetical protein
MKMDISILRANKKDTPGRAFSWSKSEEWAALPANMASMLANHCAAFVPSVAGRFCAFAQQGFF